jgi:hypothetical protein
VLPDYNTGKPIAPEYQGYGSTTGFVRMLFENKNFEMVSFIPPRKRFLEIFCTKIPGLSTYPYSSARSMFNISILLI